MYLVPICRWFLHYPMEKSRLLFFYREKAEKTWGKTGQNGGRGDLFAMPNVHCNPSMAVDIKMLVLTLIFFVFFFALKRSHDCILQYV